MHGASTSANRPSWVILCEGARDSNFFRHLIRERGLPHFAVTCPTENTLDGELIETGGRAGFSLALRGFRAGTKWADLSAILIASDNDDDPTKSFGEVQKQIIDAGGYAVPEEPLKVARIPESVPIAVVMVPWKGEQGSLDTLCLQPMYDKWPNGRECLDGFCACTSVNTWTSVSKRSKLRVQVLLSAMCPSDPNTTLRYAWSGGGRGDPVPLQHRAFDRVAEFLRDFGTLLAS